MAERKPLSQTSALFWVKRRITRHWIASVKQESKLKVVFVSISAVFLWLFVFMLSLAGFFVFESFGRELMGVGDLTVGDLVMARLLSVFALALFVMLTFSNLMTAFVTLYRSKDVPPQLLAPIPTSTFFLGRFYDCITMSSWASAFLVSPVLLAYGITAKAPPLFYPMLVAYFIPFVVIPAAIGSILAMGLVRVLATVRRGPLTTAGFVLAIGLFTFFRGKLTAPDFSNTATVQAILDAMGRTQSPFLPSYWMSQGVLASATGMLNDAAFYFFMLLINAAFFLFLATVAAEAWFYKGYSAMIGGNQHKKVGNVLHGLERVFGFLPQPHRSLFVKDFKLFWRDPAQWSQFVIFFGVMALYVANLGGARGFTSRWSEWATVLNMAACMLILASLTSRFVYPLVSLEGARIWIVGLAPVGMRRVMRQKFWLSVMLTSVFTVTLAILSAWRLDLDFNAFMVSIVAICAATVALSGLSVGLGSLYPNFREDNPSRIVSGMGGTLNFILSMIYVALVTVALAQVMLFKPSSGIWSSQTSVTLWMGAIIIALTVIATSVPMWLGRRNLERAEF